MGICLEMLVCGDITVMTSSTKLICCHGAHQISALWLYFTWCSILLFIINYSLSTWFSGHAQKDHMGFSFFVKMVALIFDL